MLMVKTDGKLIPYDEESMKDKPEEYKPEYYEFKYHLLDSKNKEELLTFKHKPIDNLDNLDTHNVYMN